MTRLRTNHIWRSLATSVAAFALASCGGGGSTTASTSTISAAQIANQRLMAASGVTEPSQLVIGPISLKSSDRIGRTSFRYQYQVYVQNNGPSAVGSTVTLLTVGAGTKIVQGSFSTGAIAAGASILSGTVTVEQDRTVLFSTNGWTWEVKVTPPPTEQLTEITFAATVPPAVIDKIAEVTSPIDNGPATSAIRTPILSNGDSTVVLASDLNGDIVLASMSDGPNVLLSEDSTALAFVRLALGSLPFTSPTEITTLSRDIRTMPSYPILVQAISKALLNSTTPSVTQEVQVDIGNVLTELTSTYYNRVVSAPNNSVKPTGLSGAPVDKNRLPLFIGFAGQATQKLYFTGMDNLRKGQVSNAMPIYWGASVSSSTSATTETMIGAPVLLPRYQVTLLTLAKLLVSLPSATGVPELNSAAPNSDFNLSVYQTDATRYSTYADFTADGVSLLLSFSAPYLAPCAANIASAVISPVSLGALAQQTTVKGTFLTYLREGFTGLPNLANIQSSLFTCASSLSKRGVVFTPTFMPKVINFLAAFNLYNNIVNGVGFAAEIGVQEKYASYDFSKRATVSYCELGAVLVNCAARLELIGPGQSSTSEGGSGQSTIKKGATEQLSVVAFDSKNTRTLAPVKLTWLARQPAIADINNRVVNGVSVGVAGFAVQDDLTGVTSVDYSVTVEPIVVRSITISSAACSNNTVSGHIYSSTSLTGVASGEIGDSILDSVGIARLVPGFTYSTVCQGWTGRRVGNGGAPYSYCTRNAGDPVTTSWSANNTYNSLQYAFGASVDVFNTSSITEYANARVPVSICK